MRVLSLLLVVGFVLAQPALGDAPQNDAGTSTDAGNAKASATPLPGYGAYAGELRSIDDDWYVVSRAAAPACVQLDASGETDANATLSIRSSGVERFIRAPLVANGTTRLALAGRSVDRAWVGVEATRNPSGYDAARPRYYRFALNETASAADAGTGMDAGSMLSDATPVVGGCFAGSLKPLAGLGDVRDLYAFHVAGNTDVVYSLASAMGVSLQLLDASGAAVGPALMDDGVATFTPPTDGTFYLQASAVSGADTLTYVVGLVGPDPPPGSPCRPHCAVGTA